MTDLTIYDKAKFHFEGDYPSDLAPEQAYVHIGIYFAWLCRRRLVSEMIVDDFEPELRRFQEGEITGPQLFRLLGGTLASDMLSEDGNRFTAIYYSDKYLDDYSEVLGGDLPTLYHVADIPKNQELMEERLDQRFANQGQL